jgi:hypothetical protein
MNANEVRAAMPPEMLKVCEVVKARFPGMRLLYLSTDALTVGREVADESATHRAGGEGA